MRLRYNTQSTPAHSSLAKIGNPSQSPEQWKATYKYMIETNYPSRRLLFLDGSKQLSTSACGIWSHDFQLRSRLPSDCTIYTAEPYAVYKAITIIAQQPGEFLILTDCLSFICSLQNIKLQVPLSTLLDL